MTLSVPANKLAEILKECNTWLQKLKASKKMVQSLVGRLLYITHCIPPARRFLSRILATLAGMEEGQWIALKPSFKLEVLWFGRYAEQANGVYYYHRVWASRSGLSHYVKPVSYTVPGLIAKGLARDCAPH